MEEKMNNEIILCIMNNKTWLDEICFRCENDDNKKRDCISCKGKGFILTDEGEAIIDLIKRHKP